MRVTSKGQVTIPIEIRQQFGIDADTEVEFSVRNGEIVLARVPDAPARARRIVGRLLATPYRGPSTDTLLAWTRGEPE